MSSPLIVSRTASRGQLSLASGSFFLLLGMSWSPLSAAAPKGDPGGAEFFTQKVRPVLVRHCYSCHSHAGGKTRGGLALDSRSGWEKGGDSGPAVIPGKPEKSLLILAVQHARSDLKMPPKEKLSKADVDVLIEWVKRGAPDPRVLAKKETSAWWSLKPLAHPTPPASPGAADPIDAFVRAKLREKGLTPAPEADRRTLIRRLTFDLHGLPPTSEEVDAFVGSDDPQAYEKVVDRLLASPRYGERWARHWLDVVRYGDSNGNEHDGFREHAWRYRDYVIDAFNRDTPYDRFIQEQLAADALFPRRPELTAALGFLAAGPDVLSGTEDLIRDEFVTTAMTAFASTTAHCARCHDHKFDPISQQDYYALQSIFAGVRRRVAPVDVDPATRAARARWTALQAAAGKRDKQALLSDESRSLIASWEKARAGKSPRWQPLIPRSAAATSGAAVEVHKDGSLQVGKSAAGTDVYKITIPGPIDDLRTLRLEVLSGLGEGGSFSLSEIEVFHHSSEKDAGRKVTFRASLSDEVEAVRFAPRGGKGGKITGYELTPKNAASTRAHDNKEDTGWAGRKAATAVFEVNKEVRVAKGGRLEVVLKQRQADRLLGSFRLSFSDQPLSPYSLVPAAVAEALAVAAEKRKDGDWLALAVHCLPTVADEAIAQLPPRTDFYVVAGTLPDEGAPSPPKTVNVLRRGESNRSLGVAVPGALSCVSGLEARVPASQAKEEAARRAYLARWLSDPKNPLTWRSIVNRLWHHHFGRGLVTTLNDFGRMGAELSHPELLDWLACQLRDNGASLKSLHRLILTSAAYKRAVRPDATAEKIDADNRLLWRGSRNRLDAESFRDSVLAVSGRLDVQMGGPGVLQFEVKPGFNTTKLANYENVDWDAPAMGRRSVYRFIFRTRPDPFMAALDFPDASQFVPARAFSASPLQALALYNNHFVLHHSDRLARLAAGQETDLSAQVRQAFRLALQRAPTSQEAKLFGSYADRHGLAAACRVLLNSNEFLFVE